jgi:hypothetical protein
VSRAVLALRVWRSWLGVRARVHSTPLPELVERVSAVGAVAQESPERLARAVDRSLVFRGRRPTCLVSALVLFHLLRRQGDDAELVIGLPSEARDQTAHAWVELNGRDVGPPPGRNGHAELARFS